ncbi:hypothetical protein ACFWBX_06525 [Streptomyces sp. NPDC059991]|uniref:hypothetical protein n=1 Tax=Streptomyces sp. NPDC059991 TaxID=3347028 RepID=UPI0036B2B26E
MGTSVPLLRESDVVSAWLEQAAAEPVDRWRKRPHLPRLLNCGITFDLVLTDAAAFQTTTALLEQYEQPLGPALVLPAIGRAAVLVPQGIADKWRALIESLTWPPAAHRPLCLGQGHTIQIPGLAAHGGVSLSRWAVAPEASGPYPPLLTSAGALARCLMEARGPLKTELTAGPDGQTVWRH